MAGNVGDSARLREPQGLSGEGSARSLFELAGLISGGAALAFVLWWLNGPPQIPSASPDWERMSQILTGSYLPYEDVISVATGLGWIALGYLALTLALRVASQMLVRLTDGAAWTRAALRLSDIATLPVVRRIMDGALAGTLVLAVWLRGDSAPEAGASSEMVSAVAVAAQPRPTLMHSVAGPDPCEPVNEAVGDPLSSDCFVSYTVVEGDNLWDISRRFYGDGTLYMAIFRANEGRVMTTGEAFTDPRLIRPRWALAVPLPGYNVWDAGARVMYRVRPDDSLWRISESLLGDGLRWTEIWELNEGREMGGGRRFTDPSLIRPDWVLELPIEVTLGSPRPIAEPAETAPAPAPSPTVAPPATPEPEAEAAPHVGPTLVPVQQPSADGDGAWDWSPPARSPVLVTAAGLAAAGAVALVVRQLVRRNGRPAFRPAGGQGRGKAPARGDVGRVVLAARALVRGLAELGFDDLRLVLARESERFLEFALECAPGDAEAVVRSRYDLGRRLACAVDGEVASSTRIRLKLSRFQRLAGLLVDEGAEEESLLLVPAGAAENGVYYLNLAAAGNAIVVGSRHEAWKLLSAWLATLAAVYRPDHLAFLPAGGAASHLGDAASLPHIAMPAGEAGERSVDELATELEETIVAREAASSGREQRAAILGVAALSGECRAEIGRLETVLRRGPEHGISTVCIAEEETETQALSIFGARLLFGGLAEAMAVAGSDALGAGPGELALSVGREPPLILKAVEVRSEALRPIARQDTRPERQAPPRPVVHEKTPAARDGWEDGEPEPQEVAPDDAEELPDSNPTTAALEAGGEAPSEPEAAEAPNSEAGNQRASRQAPLLLAEEEAPVQEAINHSGPLFAVRCLGSFQVEADGHEVTEWKIQKARELLAYLIARGGTPVLRDEVAEALWPDGEPAQVQHMLSNAAYYLRRALKSAAPNSDIQGFVTSGQRYHLRSGMFRVDVDAFDAHLRRAEALEGTEALAEYERALELYRGDLLGNEPYEWADAYRREYQRRFVAAAHKGARLEVVLRDEEKAMSFYRAILARDPIDEEAARGLMRCYEKLGDANGARKVYKVLCESLRRELEDEKAQPLPETTALLQEFIREPKGS